MMVVASSSCVCRVQQVLVVAVAAALITVAVASRW